MNLFNLFAKLTLDDSDYKKKIEQSGKSASSFASKAGTAFKVGAKAVVGFATAVAAGATAVLGLATKVADFAGDIDDNAQRLGMSTDAYQKWSMALKLGGAEQSTFAASIREMTNFTTQLSEGNADALITLEKLGVGYEEFVNMSPEQQFKTLVEALQATESQTEKTRLAQELFGNKAYQDLMPVLNMEVGALGELFQQTEDLGLIMSEDAVKAGAEFGDQLDILKQKIVVAGASIVGDFLPSASLFLEGILDMATGAEGGSEKILQSFDEMTDGVLDLIVGLIDNLPEMLPQMMSMSTMLIEKLLESIAEIDLGDLLLTVFETGMDYLFNDLPRLIETLQTTLFSLLENMFSADNLGRLGALAINLGISIVNSIIKGLNRLGNITIPGLTIFGQKIWDDTNIKLFELPQIPLVKFAKGGMFDDLMNGLGTVYALGGENGAEIAHTGSRGTGIANIEQIADAQYMAMQDYGIKEALGETAEAIVNGVVTGLRQQNSRETGNGKMIVKIGEREFKAYVVEATNQVLRSNGRKSLNKVTAY